MSHVEQVITMTLAEYLAWEEQQPDRNELVAGRAYAMSGGTERHGLMVGYLSELISPAARAHGCRPFSQGRRLVVPAGDAYYPDVLVSCGRAGHAQYETDATLVVEVLSPTTRATDKREKLSRYGQLLSIAAYVLVEPDIRRIEVARWPGGELQWEALGPGDGLNTPYGSWDLDAIYDVIDAVATT